MKLLSYLLYIYIYNYQRWMTNEILDMMEERRLLKYNECLYRQNDVKIQKECHKANENILSQKCDLIEQSNLMNALV